MAGSRGVRGHPLHRVHADSFSQDRVILSVSSGGDRLKDETKVELVDDLKGCKLFLRETRPLSLHSVGQLTNLQSLTLDIRAHIAELNAIAQIQSLGESHVDFDRLTY
jgi:hypothetical protein